LHPLEVSGIAKVSNQHSHSYGSFLRILIQVNSSDIKKDVGIELYIVKTDVLANLGILWQLVQYTVDMAFVGGGLDVGKVLAYLLVVDTVAAGRKEKCE
jgi:hypothetical protein